MDLKVQASMLGLYEKVLVKLAWKRCDPTVNGEEWMGVL